MITMPMQILDKKNSAALTLDRIRVLRVNYSFSSAIDVDGTTMANIQEFKSIYNTTKINGIRLLINIAGFFR